jgi:diguanylate cyclase (GGDEF)-like protein/PAS domain S-box-containing protein
MGYNYQDLLENMQEGVYFTDNDRRITFWNKAAERITGYKAENVIGLRCRDNILMHVDDTGTNLCQDGCPLAATISDGKGREAEVYLHHKKGHRVPVLMRVTPLRNELGEIVGVAEVFSDISSTRSMTERLKELEGLALLDDLTRLSNRRHLDMELQARLQEVQRYGLSLGVLFMDIDDFKHINDTCGHSVGDLVLQTVARTIGFTSRTFDLFGRWGGEEFVGIIRNVDEKSLVQIGQRCRALVEQSSTAFKENCELRVTLSIGATMCRMDDTIESLIARADHLMYESKRQGKNRLSLG